MKKFLFLLVWVGLAVPPFFFYTSAQFLLEDPSGYVTAVSMALGILAFTLLAGQFLLAAKPAFATAIWGKTGLVSLHGIMAVVALLVAFAHRTVKVMVLGASDDTLQARLGTLAWLGLVLVAVITVLVMANTFWMKIPLLKRLKDWAQKKAGLTYQRLRLFHNLNLLLAGTLAVHIFLASSSHLDLNPWGPAWLGGWFAVCLGFYLVYRLRGRAQPQKA